MFFSTGNLKAKRYLLATWLVVMQTSVLAIEATFTDEKINIDGYAKESIWQTLPWHLIDKPIIGDLPEKNDFTGRYKVSWNSNEILMLVEITDDVLFDAHPDPLQSYWDDDCLEIFIDEDNSGGNHQFNFNAFAYHLALDNQVVDLGPGKDNKPQALLLNNHVRNQWKPHPKHKNKIVWELAITVYDDSYQLEADNKPVILSVNKHMGFMVAYCDNDGGMFREHFIGSKVIEPVNGDRNRGYIDAGVFDQLILKKKVAKP